MNSFDENRKNKGRDIGTGHTACLQRCNGLSFYIVDVSTATDIWVALDQQAIIRFLGTYWIDNKDKLDKWIGGWVTKQMPAPVPGTTVWSLWQWTGC